MAPLALVLQVLPRENNGIIIIITSENCLGIRECLGRFISLATNKIYFFQL